MDKDKLARQKIINNLSTNFFVEASAGSGKTTALVNRMVRLIETGTAKVDKICTITFTIAAANEFFDRFQELLSIRCNKETDKQLEEICKNLDNGGLPPTTVKSREKCKEALVNIDLCMMGTLDSFANRIIHEFPNEFNVPASAGVISDDEAKLMIKKEYYKTCYDQTNLLAKRYNVIYGRNALNSFSVSVLKLLDIRDSKFVYDIADFEVNLDDYFIHEKEELITYVDLLNNTDLSSCSKQTKKLGNSVRSAGFKVKEKWNDYFADVYLLLDKICKDVSFNDSVEGTVFQDRYLVKDKRNFVYSETAKETLNNIKRKLEDYRYSIAMMLYDQSTKNIGELMRNSGKMKFFDFIYYLREKLKEDSNTTDKTLIKHIYNKHQYFLLDESQDTNPMQTEIFFYLTGRKVTSDWRDTEPIPGSLFIVGDPKQSIYRFRGADVSSYLKTEELFTSNKVGECLVLSRNYRSNKKLREWFNFSMNNVLDSKEEKLTHEDIEIDIDLKREKLELEADLDGLYVATVPDIKNQNEYLTRLINFLHKNTDYKIMPKKGKQAREIRYSDFMIITATTTATESFIKTFHDNGIPLEIEGRQLFPHSDLFKCLKTILFLAINPNSIEYLLNTYKTPLFCYTENDFILLRNFGYSFNILNEIGDECGIEKHYIQNHNILRNIVNSTMNMSYSSKMMYILHNLPLINVFGADYYECIYYAINLLKDAENNLIVRDDESAIEFINSLETSKNYERTMVFDSFNNDGKVKLANVHKVKGLQAPIVIIASPIASKIPPDIHIEHTNDGSKAILFNVVDQTDHIKNIYLSTSKYEREKMYEENCSDAEHKRLEYVAATRAESVLILVKSQKEISKNSINPWQNLLNNVYDNLPELPDVSDEGNEDTRERVSANELKASNVSLSALNDTSYSVVLPSKEASCKSYRNNNIDIEDENIIDTHNARINLENDDIQNNIKGTCIHRLMEMLVNAKKQFKLEDLVSSIVNEFDVPNYFNELLKTAKNVVSGGFKQIHGSLPDDILSLLLSADKVMCEVPFSYKDKNNVVYGTIDCIFLKDNKWTIIDYKTNNEDDILKLNEEYMSQLNLYVKAFKCITGNDSNAFIYHINK